MAALIGAGLLHKKDRILCCRDRDDTMGAWLRRQRFKVETASIETPHGLYKPDTPRFFDVLLVRLEYGESPVAAGLEHQLREAFAMLKPGGRFILFRPAEELLFAAEAGNLLHQIKGIFSVELSVSVKQVLNNENLPAEIVLAKKGGAYKPRLPVLFIDKADSFEETCRSLAEEPILGLDVETTLKEPRILCTIQLATDSRVYLIDALPLKDFSPFKALMEDASTLKIIHNKSFEEKVLGLYGISINNVYDTLIESRKRYKKDGDGGHKLGEVCERELGIYLDKSLQASDWTCRPLTQEQRDYAAADAEVLLKLYRLFVPPPVPENLELF